MNKNDLLYEKLRQWRNKKAFAQGVQAFMILNNAVLKRTAEQIPQTKQELQKIKGWGKIKLKKYADEVLNIIHKFLTQQDNEQFLEQQQNFYFQEEIENILTVEECFNLINLHLSNLTILKVKGEINDISARDRYAFFNLKDQKGIYTLPCFIGWNNFYKYQHLIEEGQEVIVSGFPNLYKNGRFTLDIKRIEPVGLGALKKAFELLKKNLEHKGYFDESRKQQLPINIQHIGLITSEHGAAIKDFQKNLKPFGFKIRLFPVFVEGDNAIPSIVNAIHKLNIDFPKLDCIVLIRGGGGLENLKAFNTLEIADAIVSSRLPIITGIGHEKDVSIADLCADKYFSTPTAVAIFLNKTKEELLNKIDNSTIQLYNKMKNNIENSKYELNIHSHLLIQTYMRFLQTQKNKISIFLSKLDNFTNNILNKIKLLEQNLYTKIEDIISQYKNKLTILNNSLINLNPENILKKGYSLVYDEKNNIIKTSKKVKIGQKIKIKLYKGKIISKIIKK